MNSRSNYKRLIQKKKDIYICTIDKVGNISSEAYEIIVSNKDKEAADMYDLTGSPTEWTKNNVTLTGSALANNASFYRPAFNLNTNVYYTSGSGTEYDPIRIK